MPHFKVDDALHCHPKTERAGDEAMGLWVRAGCFSMAYLTDGFVPDWWIKKQRKGHAKAQKLVAAELWHRAERDGETGYEFHQWRQDSKERIEADREKARERQARFRSMSRRDIQRDSAKTTGYIPVPNTHTHTHTHLLVTSSGELTEVEPPQFCPRHPSGTEKPCGVCADARRTHEAWAAQQRENELIQRRHARELRDQCPLCDETGWRLGIYPLEKCTHEVARPA